MKLHIIIFILISIHVKQNNSADPVVQLTNGLIVGRQDVTAENNLYYSFEKIPYAAPPIGNLRFKAPQPVEDWDGILNTTYLDVSCYQLGIMGQMPPMLEQSEDCLFLNVFTPKLTNETEDLLPVMVHIYGGGFTIGSSATSPDLFVDKNVILVSFNYRLGVFGFISTQDDVIPGNTGLKDQLQAIKWVNQNIHLFGGDPNKVTIFGGSAGAASCAHHTLNQNSLGLFQGVILSSGTFLCTGMFQRNSRQIAFGTGAVLNSTFDASDDSEALLDFLLTLDAEELNGAANQYSVAISNSWDGILEVGSIFAPVIEAKNPDAFITKKMYGLLKAGNVVPVPIFMGFNSEEKIAIGMDEELLKSITQILDENLDYLVPADMEIADVNNRTQMGSLIRNIYTGGEPFSDNLGDAIRFASDTFLTRSMEKHAELYSQFAATYFYEFSYEGSFGPQFPHYDGAGSVGHGTEINYLFCSGTSCNDATYPEADLLERQRLITLFTNFAKYQNPTPEPLELLQNVTWTPVSTDGGDFFYLDIGADLEVKNHPKGEVYSKWIELYDSLGYDDFDTF